MNGTSTIRQANLKHRRSPAISRHFSGLPVDNLQKITADFGILQHEKINRLHGRSFHTLADNALALISSCRQYQISQEPDYLQYISRYLHFIELSQKPDGSFTNIRTSRSGAHDKNNFDSADSLGHTVWALGYLIALQPVLPEEIISKAETMMQKAMLHIENVKSARANALMIKGLYFYNTHSNSIAVSSLIKTLADRIAQTYLESSTKEWQWFDTNITLGDSVIPEAMLCAFLDTDEYIYQDIAKSSFDFLLLKTFTEFPANSNKTRIRPSRKISDVVNVVLALSKFFGYYKENFYLSKINSAYGRFSSQPLETMRVA